ncbi:MGDG synthase family glycosyltransferase [Paenibacillus thalictri]|nr:glycosyltransferase [Paenibacillus thalictri]
MMKHNPRVLILTACYGEGHLQAARSLKQSFHGHGVDDVEIMDLMKEAHPVIDKITATLYIKSMLTAQFGFDYYAWSYYMTKSAKPDAGFARFINNLGKKKLKEKLERDRPDAVICTFPFGAVPELCSRLGIAAYTIVTDFTMHSRWIQPKMDKYYVATEELMHQLVSNGFGREQIEVSGIPIRPVFEESALECNPYRSVFDPTRKLILILAGSYGVLGNVDEMIQQLQQIEDVQLAVVCGRNAKLLQKLNEKVAGTNHIHIFGFVEDIHHLMLLSSCIVTKAGGLTLSEALALEIPIFIYKPFAGQEKENALYLQNKHLAFVSDHTEALARQIEQFLSEEIYNTDMKRRIRQFKKVQSADYIISDILKQIRAPRLEPVLV